MKLRSVLVVLVVAVLGYGTRNITSYICPGDCDGVTEKETCFQNANNKSYCLCTAENVCRSVIECDASSDDVLNDTRLGGPVVLPNISSVCFLRDTCPDHFTDNITRALCETPSSYKKSVHYDMFPVQVKEDGLPNMNFKNSFCALCNGKFNYTYWKVAVDLNTCDIFNIDLPPHANPLDSLSVVPGCEVFPVAPDPICDVCEYPDLFFFEGLPVLSALFNFSPKKEPPIEDRSVEPNCDMNETSAISQDTTNTCGLGQTPVAGVCQKVFSYRHGIHEFRFYKQILQNITKEEGLDLTSSYITFLHDTAVHRLNVDMTLIERWDVKVTSGQTVTGGQCAELQLSIIVDVGDKDISESTLRDALNPCSGSSSSHICFVPGESTQRETFCHIQQCNEKVTTKLSRNMDWNVQSFITVVSLSLSIIALLLSVCIFVQCPLFHSLPGRINLCLMLSVLCSQLLYLSSALFYKMPLTCQIVGVLSHYMWLCSFTWMSVCAFHTWFTFGRRNITRNIQASEMKTLLRRYGIIAVSFPLLVVLSCIIADLVSPGFTMGYGKSICFITDPIGITVGFAGPVALTLVTNLVLFVVTIVNMQKGSDIVSDLRSSRTFFFIYTKLSSLMGFTWICAYVAELVGASWLDTTSTVINGLQGVFICMSFVCNKRVYKWMKTFACRQCQHRSCD
ncbi:uncharacterized protein [Argopecten irradians]|uniref:uncharacterized protein n=1 Tax=Argopecten irradians TaxID=31199 RepID=UPI00371B288D